MTVSAIRPTPSDDRAVTPEVVAAEITHGVKDRDWVLRTAPAHCRWAGPRTRPPLFSYKRTLAWWHGEMEKAS